MPSHTSPINQLSWTECGFATLTQVTGPTDFVGGENRKPRAEQERLNTQHHNEMPSYFLSETIKYLYLTFDAENSILHQDSERDWIFTTEAHPIHYVPVSSSTIQQENGLDAQLEKVRSLLRFKLAEDTRRTNSTAPSSIDEDISANATAANHQYGDLGHLKHEQWSHKTPESIFAESILSEKRKTIASKRETVGVHDFESGPPFSQRSSLSLTDITSPGQTSSFGIFSSEVLGINQANYQFNDQGKGSGNRLGKRCPNYHHPDLMWAHALHHSLDYHAAHSSSVSSKAFTQKHATDERKLTALASVCFYDTDYYADGIDANKNSCPVEEAPSNAKIKHVRKDKDPPMAFTIPGATRYNMGKEKLLSLGAMKSFAFRLRLLFETICLSFSVMTGGSLGEFDVATFPQGDGFIVKHVNSNELLEVSIFHDNPESESGTVILVMLTIPPYIEPIESLSSRKHSHSRFLFSQVSTLESWRRRLRRDSKNGDLSGEDSPSEFADNGYARNVVGTIFYSCT